MGCGSLYAGALGAYRRDDGSVDVRAWATEADDDAQALGRATDAARAAFPSATHRGQSATVVRLAFVASWEPAPLAGAEAPPAATDSR